MEELTQMMLNLHMQPHCDIREDAASETLCAIRQKIIRQDNEKSIQARKVLLTGHKDRRIVNQCRRDVQRIGGPKIMLQTANDRWQSFVGWWRLAVSREHLGQETIICT